MNEAEATMFMVSHYQSLCATALRHSVNSVAVLQPSSTLSPVSLLTHPSGIV